MDSLAQELIDAIIDHTPDRDMPSCSLVARRWRQHSQRRHFDFVIFSGEDQMVLWDAKIPKDPDGIPSYVHHAQVRDFSSPSWSDPTIFGRVLKTFSSMESLMMDGASIPLIGQPPGLVSLGEFGKRLTSLSLRCQTCTLATIMSFILSFPDLEELALDGCKIRSGARLPTLPDTLQTRPLRMLSLELVPRATVLALAQCRFTCNSLSLDVLDHGIEQLIMVSSKTVENLSFRDLGFVLPDSMISEVNTPLPQKILRLPTLSTLATLKIDICSVEISDRLEYLLSSIQSAPVLSSVTFAIRGSLPWLALPTPDQWVGVDKWLIQLAGERDKAKGGLEVMLSRWPRGNTNWEGYFPEFREAGGRLTVEFVGAHS